MHLKAASFVPSEAGPWKRLFVASVKRRFPPIWPERSFASS